MAMNWASCPVDNVIIAHKFICGKRVYKHPSSPEGTNEIGVLAISNCNFSIVPYGLIWILDLSCPNNKLLGYFHVVPLGHDL
jgi:hypothetical protein